MIIALHGFGSSAETSNTIKTLLSHFEDTDVIYAPSYPSADADQTAKHLLQTVKFLEELHPEELDLTFVGISLGGFWARYLADRNPGSTLVMLNPALRAHETLQKYVGENDFTKEAADEFSKYCIAKDRGDIPITMIVAEDDDVIPANIALEAITEDRAHVIRTTGGHRLLDTLESHIPDIEFAVNNIT